MFLNQIAEQRHTLAFRLTLWYGAIFILSSLLAFSIFYTSAVSSIYGRVDEELMEEMIDLSEMQSNKGLSAVIREIEEEDEEEDPDELFFRLMGTDFSEIKSTDLSGWMDLPLPEKKLIPITADHHLSKEQRVIIETYAIPGKPYKVRIATAAIGEKLIMQSGIVLEKEEEMILILKRLFYMTMAGVFFIAAIVGWLMARRALSGIQDIRQTAWQISMGEMSQRVPQKKRGTEIEELAVMFNNMLDHIDKLIRKMREMTDNIAHDLKSPITRIRGVAEVTLTTGTSDRTIEDYEIMASNTIEECESLLEMINTMLDISEAETGTEEIEFKELNMAALVRDVCELFEPIAEMENIALTVDAPHCLWLNGDKKKLQRAMANLLDNALKYTPDNGTIEVLLCEERREEVTLRINDTGIGIPRTDIPYIFDRFYRCDQSRSKPGNGLGLSLVKAIISSHKGKINVTSTPDQGSSFEIKLPGLTLEQLCSTFDIQQNVEIFQNFKTSAL